MTETPQGAQKSSLRTSQAGPLLVVMLACLAAYANALAGSFVYDDNVQVLKNYWITDVRYVPTIFSSSVWSFQPGTMVSNYYRPVMHLIYMAAYHVFGLAPWGFHLVNVVLHLGVTFLVFDLAAKLLVESRGGGLDEGLAEPVPGNVWTSVPFLAALLFAVHPIHTEAVTWVAGLPEVSFTFFVLLALECHVRGGAAMTYGAAPLFFFLATLCKETALVLPVLIAAYDFGVRREAPDWRECLRRYLPYVLVVGLYLAMRLHALGGFAPEKKFGQLTPLQLVINIFPLFAEYVWMLVWPVDMNAYHVFHPILSPADPRVIGSFLFACGYAAALMFCWRRQRTVWFCLTLMFLPLLPVLYISAVGENVFAERYLYLPSFGFVVLVGLGARRSTRLVPGMPRAVPVLALAVLATLYAAQTVARNAIWGDEFRLWEDTVRKAPDVSGTHAAYGFTLLQKGRLDEAIAEYETALKLTTRTNRNEYLVYDNLGVAYYKQGRLNDSIRNFRIALDLNPGFASGHNNLGLVYMKLQQFDLAHEEFRMAVGFDPNTPQYRANLADAYRFMNARR